MEKKKIIAIIACVLVLAIGVGSGIYFGGNKNSENETTKELTTVLSTEQTTALTTEEVTVSTTAVSTTDTTISTTKKDPNAFLYDGYWYIFDDDKVSAYAIKFEENGNAKISYFNTDNVMGGDAKYLKNGSADYKINGKKINVSNLPAGCGDEGLELELKSDNTVYFLGVQAQHKKDLKLDYPFNYFNS